MLAALVGVVAASGLLLRGAWDPWAQSIVLLVLLAGVAAWLSARLASGWVPAPAAGLVPWAAGLAALAAASAWLSPVPAYAKPAWTASAAGLALIPLGAVLDQEGRARVERFIRAAAWLLVLLALHQRLHGETRPAAAFLNQNVFAGAILLLLPVAARASDWTLTAGLLLCLWWTRSVGAWLGLSGALLLHRRAAGPAAFWLGAAAGFVALVASYAKLQSPGIEHRVVWWAASWRMAAGAPLLGLGPGSFAYALPAHVDAKPELYTLFAHQHVLETAAERGWPYALLWLAGLGALLGPAPQARRIGPVAALLHGLGDYALSVPGVFWLFCVSVALAAPVSGRSFNVPLRARAALVALALAAAGAGMWAVNRSWKADRLRARALAMASESRLPEAAAALAESETLVPHPEAARLRAELALAAGAKAEAEGHLERAIALDPFRASNRRMLESLRGTAP